MTILSFSHVSLIRESKPLLQDISWHVQKNENWAILGLNGAGKTLLLQLITGQLWPSKGRLEVLGEVFGHTSIPDLQRRIGWVSSALQYRLHGTETAERIVLSGKFASIGIYQSYTEEDIALAVEKLTMLGGAHLVGRTLQVLSQGERQVVLIARSLMANPELLILDEPCNGLDLFAREELLTLIANLARSKEAPSLLFVTHHTEEILPIFQHVLMIKKGQLFAQGSYEHVFQEDTLAQFYEKPIHIQHLPQHRLLVTPK